MTTEELFNEKNIDIFMPNDGVEFIYSIIQNMGYRDFTTEKARGEGLQVIEKLFELELIEIFNWGKYHKLVDNLDLDNIQKIGLIRNIWFVGADYPDFLEMPMFKHRDWYTEALKKEGLTTTTHWRTFVKEKIGDLEKWIEKNRPKP